jgi:hypothetical protein
MEYSANILGSERPEDFAVRDLSLISGDYLGTWFPTVKSGTNGFMKRFEPLTHNPDVPGDKVELDVKEQDNGNKQPRECWMAWE